MTCRTHDHDTEGATDFSMVPGFHGVGFTISLSTLRKQVR
jgi:hypothetical protein